MQEQAPTWPTQRERKLDRLILLFVIGLVVAVLLMLTRAAYAARRIATQETIATALFHIDAVVALEAVAQEIRYDPGAQAARAVRTRAAAYTTFEREADLYAAGLDSAPAAATYAAALFENTIPAATIEAAAQATLRTAYQDHQEAAALATTAVTYEAQALATVEAQEALPLWYWLLPQS